MRRRSLGSRGDGENRGAHAHDHCSAKYAGPAAPAGLAQFIEEEEAPENTEKAVGIPERESDAEADVSDGEDGERVCYRPQATRKQRPNYEMGSTEYVGSHGGCAEDQGGEAPTRKENAHDHDERNHNWGDADGDELCWRFRRAQPCSCGEAAENAEELQAAVAGWVVDLGERRGSGIGWHESPWEELVNEFEEQKACE